MKVLFLDIDGVLKEESYKAAFQDECFARLKRIVDATDAQIILTSSWRVNYWKFVEDGFQTENEDVLRLHEYFEKYGLKVSGRTDLTRRSGPDSRPSEIRNWLADKPDIDTFCILDDDDFYRWKWLSQFLVVTRVKTIDEDGYSSWKRTLSDADVEKAIRILNTDNKALVEEQFTP